MLKISYKFFLSLFALLCFLEPSSLAAADCGVSLGGGKVKYDEYHSNHTLLIFKRDTSSGELSVTVQTNGPTLTYLVQEASFDDSGYLSQFTAGPYRVVLPYPNDPMSLGSIRHGPSGAEENLW